MHETPLSCQLAAEVALKRSKLKSEVDIWGLKGPTKDAFIVDFPIFWPKEAQDCLPMKAKICLNSQINLFKRDYGYFKISFKDIEESDFKYAWIIVQSRAFADDDIEKDDEGDDCETEMALLPIADRLNHSAEAEVASTTEDSYIFTAGKYYRAGEEVCISYGNLTNDELLVDYGFLLEHNPHDKAYLDIFILDELKAHKDLLSKYNLWGDYVVISCKGICNRTRAIMFLLCCQEYKDIGIKVFKDSRFSHYTLDQWGEYLKHPLLEDDINIKDSNIAKINIKAEMNKKLYNVVSKYLEYKMMRVDKIAHEQDARRIVLKRRWGEIGSMIETLIKQRPGS